MSRRLRSSATIPPEHNDTSHRIPEGCQRRTLMPSARLRLACLVVWCGCRPNGAHVENSTPRSEVLGEHTPEPLWETLVGRGWPTVDPDFLPPWP